MGDIEIEQHSEILNSTEVSKLDQTQGPDHVQVNCTLRGYDENMVQCRAKIHSLEFVPKPFHVFWDFILLRKSIRKTSHKK